MGKKSIVREGHPLLNYVYLMNSLIPDLLESGLDVSVKIEGIIDSYSGREERLKEWLAKAERSVSSAEEKDKDSVFAALFSGNDDDDLGTARNVQTMINSLKEKGFSFDNQGRAVKEGYPSVDSVDKGIAKGWQDEAADFLADKYELSADAAKGALAAVGAEAVGVDRKIRADDLKRRVGFRTGQLDSAFNHGGDFSPLYGALVDMKKRPRLPIFVNGQRVLEPGYDSYLKDVGLTSVYDSIYPGLGTPFLNLNSPETQKLLKEALLEEAPVKNGRKAGFDRYDLDKLEKLLEAKNNALFAGYEHIRTPEGETISIPSREMIKMYDVISDSLATLWARFMKGISAADRKARKATQLASQMLGDENGPAAIAQTNAVLGNFRDWAERNVPEIVPKLDKAWREYRVPEWTLDDEGRERLNSNMEKLVGNMLGHYNEYAKEKSRIHGLEQSFDPTEINTTRLNRLDDADNALEIGPDEFSHLYKNIFGGLRQPKREKVLEYEPYFKDLLFVENPGKKDSMGRPKYMLAPGVAELIKTKDADGKDVWNHPLIRSIVLRAMLDRMRENPDEDLREFGRHLFDTRGLSQALYDSGDPHAVASIDARDDIEGRVYNYLANRNNPNLKWVQNVGYVFQPPKKIEDMTEEEYNHARNVALGKE